MKYTPLIFSFIFILLLCSCDDVIQSTKVIASPYQTLSPVENEFLSGDDVIQSTKVLASPYQTLSPAGKEFLSGKEIGNQLKNAIEQYKRTHGNYPQSLSELIPEYFNSIPLTITGQEFSYKILDPSAARLSYGLCFVITQNINTMCCNSPYYDGWECGPRYVP
jgi:hypothetical protein